MKLLKIILCLIFILNFYGCSKGEVKMRSKTEILYLINNNRQYNELITKTYKYIDSVNLFGEKIEQVDKIYQIECLREKDNYLYSIIKLEKNAQLFIMFEEFNKEYIVTDIWIYEKNIYLEDFLKLEIGISTIENVKNIDSFGNYVLYASSIEPSSFHYTIDGFFVKIIYGENFVVSNVDYNEVTENSIIYNLLLIDKNSLES